MTYIYMTIVELTDGGRLPDHIWQTFAPVFGATVGKLIYDFCTVQFYSNDGRGPEAYSFQQQSLVFIL